MNTHLEVSELESGSYQVKAVQGHVVTVHAISVDPGFSDRNGWGAVTGTVLVREVVEILLEHEALAGVPADARLEQLLSHYPYLATELQQRLSTESLELPLIESAVVDPRPAEDHPTHA